MDSKNDPSRHKWRFWPRRPKRSEKDEKIEKTKHNPTDPNAQRIVQEATILGLMSLRNFLHIYMTINRARFMVKDRTLSMKDKVEEFKREAERLQNSSNEKDWKFSRKGQDILVRDLTTRIVGWTIKIGDIAMPFAPATSPAAAVWGCATIFLRVSEVP